MTTKRIITSRHELTRLFDLFSSSPMSKPNPLDYQDWMDGFDQFICMMLGKHIIDTVNKNLDIVSIETLIDFVKMPSVLFEMAMHTKALSDRERIYVKMRGDEMFNEGDRTTDERMIARKTRTYVVAETQRVYHYITQRIFGKYDKRS